jgi:hypothetical protein
VQQTAQQIDVTTYLEADKVGSEHALEDFVASGEAAEDLRAGEGSVQEEADRCFGLSFANHLGDQEEMVVVHPDEVTGTVDLCDASGEDLVDVLVGFPRLVGGGVFGGDVLPEEVVEEGP